MRLLLIPLDDTVLFPNMTATIADVGDEKRVLVVPRRGEGFADVGTVAEVIDTARVPGAGAVATLGGLHRGIPGSATPDPEGRLRVEVTELHDGSPADGRIRELEREYRAMTNESLELRGDDGRVAAFLRSISEPGALADTSSRSEERRVG